MKNKNRIVKAIVVIVIVGFVSTRNNDFKSSYSTISSEISQKIQQNDSTKSTSNTLLVFSEVIFESGLKQQLSKF